METPPALVSDATSLAQMKTHLKIIMLNRFLFVEVLIIQSYFNNKKRLPRKMVNFSSFLRICKNTLNAKPKMVAIQFAIILELTAKTFL